MSHSKNAKMNKQQNHPKVQTKQYLHISRPKKKKYKCIKKIIYNLLLLLIIMKYF